MKTLFVLGLLFLVSLSLGLAADSTIHGLPAKTVPAATDVTVIDDGTHNWKATIGSIQGGSPGTTIENVYITSNYVSYSYITNLYAETTYITTNIVTYQWTTNNYVSIAYVTNFNGKFSFTTFNTNQFSYISNAYITNLYVVSLQGVKGYIVLASPFDCDGTGTKIYTNDNTKTYFGQAQFNNAADQAANYCDYYITVPEDFDTAVDWIVERFKFQLSASDTGTHRYVISLSSVADSAAYAGSLGQAINLDFAGDASGAQGDVETVANVTLTAWKSNMTKGQLLVIRVARDGNDAADASTVDSYSGPIVISYGVKQ